MPWYYAGPESKPIGPVTLEELHARRVNGTISPETYVIEHTGQPDESRAWRHYQEVFPASPALPAIPSLQAPPAASVTAPAHPLFPSAIQARPASTPPPFRPATQPVHPDHHRPTNAWCGWGFGLGLASMILLLPTCGLAFLLALPAIFASLVGLVQVHHHREQSGRGLAVGGLLFSTLALLITLIVLAVVMPKLIKQHEQTTTEQSTDDSE